MTPQEGRSGFDGKVALVTGSTTGIGEAVARRFAAQGAKVVLNSDSSREAGRRLAAELGEAHYVAADVADEAAAGRLVAEAVARFGRLDFLVNNAGITRRIPLADLESATAAVWHEILDTNLIGAWNVTRAAVPHLRATGEASIVNLTSLVAHRPMGSSIPYAVSKAALVHLTLILAKVLGPEIRVNAVSPGFVTTRWNTGQEERRAFTEAHAPLRKVAAAEDIADICLQLCEPSLITGAVLPVDGGMHLVA
jgi:ketoreductase RED2